ncbi:MAG: HTH domain-containing protein, partial [Clostridia bacterium]|nr:HTH domain-containing protein [Clostridia bacterium]
MKLDRLISILVTLLQKERVSARELAKMFEVSTRTILRDIDTLNLSGIPIVTYKGTNGGIAIAEGYKLDKSLLTSDDIAAVIATLNGVAKSLPDPKHQVLVDKFKNAIPSSQSESFKAKSNRLIIDLSPWGGNKAVNEKLSVLRSAVELQHLVE